MGLLGKSALSDELLALQFLDPVLQLVDFGFVDFEGHLDGRARRRCFGWRWRLLATGEPHDGDHEKRQSDEKPGLHVLGQKTLRLWRFFLNFGRLAHHSSSIRRDEPRKGKFLFANGE